MSRNQIKNEAETVGEANAKRPLASRDETPEAQDAATVDISTPGVERPGDEEVKKEINPNTE